MTMTTINSLAPPPTILVVGSLTPPGAADWVKEKLQELSGNVFATLRRGNAEFVFMEASAPDTSAEMLMAQVDGLLVLGGGDADPACYGQQPNTKMYSVNPDADKFEIDLIQQARTADKPVFGICRGMQLINIAFGGELIQDIGSSCHIGNFDDSLMVSHSVAIAPDSKLHAIYGSSELNIRSAHHQAIDKLGQGLKVTAWAADGIVEAIEATHENWLVGVQWHPEDADASKEDFDLLIRSFLGATGNNGMCMRLAGSEPVTVEN